MRLKFINSACIELTTSDMTILMDPWFTEVIIDYRYLFGLLVGIHHWDNAAVGSHYMTRRTPQDNYQKALVNYLNFLQFFEGTGHTVNKVVLRMDDVGASTKHFEVYSKIPFGNFLFLKYLPFFRAWGVYREIDSELWSEIFDFLVKENAKLSIAITASWVEKDGRLVPFPEKFPKESKLIKEALRENIIEISNHGLTHCVVGKHQPRLFSSNRKYHREFWDWLPQEIHNQHIERSQKIFEEWLGESPKILCPPWQCIFR